MKLFLIAFAFCSQVLASEIVTDWPKMFFSGYQFPINKVCIAGDQFRTLEPASVCKQPIVQSVLCVRTRAGETCMSSDAEPNLQNYEYRKFSTGCGVWENAGHLFTSRKEFKHECVRMNDNGREGSYCVKWQDGDVEIPTNYYVYTHEINVRNEKKLHHVSKYEIQTCPEVVHAPTPSEPTPDDTN
jgi:hypothetical protein